jgi:hypothetical protein
VDEKAGWFLSNLLADLSATSLQRAPIADADSELSANTSGCC